MKFNRIIVIGFFILFCASVNALADGYRVESDYPEVNGIYAYWGSIITSKSGGNYADIPMPVYKKTGANYYIGYRGCSTKWVITEIGSPGPTPDTIGGGPNDGFHIRNFTDSSSPPRTGWDAGHVPGVDQGTALSLEVIPIIPEEEYDLVITNVGSGSVALNPSGGTYDEGTIVTMTAVPGDAYWRFSGWSGDLSGSANPATISMDDDKAITATFSEVDQYALVITNVGLGSVTLDPPGGTYYEGTIVTVTAVPDDAYWQFSGWSGDLSGNTNPTTVTMSVAQNVTATFSLADSDGDSISDQDEDAGPNSGDANYDGTPDRLQDNVVCLHTFNQQHQIVLESEAGTTLSDCRSIDNPNLDDCPDWAEFPYGFFQFTISGIAPGGSSTLTLHLPEDTESTDPNTYYKYGPLPNDSVPQWYRFKYESSLQVGAQFNGRTVILHLIDGDMGDDDLTEDGQIQDAGGPGVLDSTDSGSPTGPTPTNDSGSGGGGGCFLQTVRP